MWALGQGIGMADLPVRPRKLGEPQTGIVFSSVRRVAVLEGSTDSSLLSVYENESTKLWVVSHVL